LYTGLPDSLRLL